jgi:hypothetical protein
MVLTYGLYQRRSQEHITPIERIPDSGNCESFRPIDIRAGAPGLGRRIGGNFAR